MKIEIKNSGTKKFPMYQVLTNGKEFCTTHSINSAEIIKRLLLNEYVKWKK